MRMIRIQLSELPSIQKKNAIPYCVDVTMHLFDANPNHKLKPNPNPNANPNPNQVVVNKAFRLKKTLHDSYAAFDSYAKELSIFLTQLC